MVFNIICLICSGIACVFIAIMFFFWVVISELLANKDCYNTSLITSLFGTKTCYCMDSSGDGFAIGRFNLQRQGRPCIDKILRRSPINFHLLLSYYLRFEEVETPNRNNASKADADNRQNFVENFYKNSRYEI